MPNRLTRRRLLLLLLLLLPLLLLLLLPLLLLLLLLRWWHRLCATLPTLPVWILSQRRTVGMVVIQLLLY